MNVISKPGLLDMLRGKSNDVKEECLAWYAATRAADWASFSDVRSMFQDADLVSGLLVFNIRQNWYRLIVYPVFSRRKLYIKALLSHKEYDRKEWQTKWP